MGEVRSWGAFPRGLQPLGLRDHHKASKPRGCNLWGNVALAREPLDHWLVSRIQRNQFFASRHLHVGEIKTRSHRATHQGIRARVAGPGAQRGFRPTRPLAALPLPGCFFPGGWRRNSHSDR